MEYWILDYEAVAARRLRPPRAPRWWPWAEPQAPSPTSASSGRLTSGRGSVAIFRRPQLVPRASPVAVGCGQLSRRLPTATASPALLAGGRS